jgi:hypothetical protein
MDNDSRKEEAAGATTAPVEFRGTTFTVPRNYDDWTVDFLESIEEGKVVGIVRGALGPVQWRTVKGMNLTIGQLQPFADAIAAAMGFGSPGESQDSSD